jgi:histone acetyltransferase
MIDFPVYKNDGVREHMRALIDLKNIIAKQLPKMPKEYITRLIMDRKHESMLILKKSETSNKVIGGIVYRSFEENEFVEIAFLAVMAIEQVKGYGTRLMNKLKAHLQKKKIKYMVTYADNNAIGYFKKQGFSTAPRIPKHLWDGYIKDYESGTLMDCYLNSDIDYNNISNELKKQKAVLLEALKKCYHFEIHKGSELEQKEVKEKRTERDLESEKVFSKIPGIAGSGWDLELYKKSLYLYSLE